VSTTWGWLWHEYAVPKSYLGLRDLLGVGFQLASVNDRILESLGNKATGLEESVISEVSAIEMYHATIEMVKQFNSHFSGKLILETLFNVFCNKFF